MEKSKFHWLRISFLDPSLKGSKEAGVAEDRLASKFEIRLFDLLNPKTYIPILVFYGFTDRVKRESGIEHIAKKFCCRFKPGESISVVGLRIFKTNHSDDLIQRPLLQFMFSLVATAANVLQVGPATFWLRNKLRINTEVWYKDMPDTYWEVGHQNGLPTPQSSSWTAYLRKCWWMMSQFIYPFKENYFAGPNVVCNDTKGSESSTGSVNAREEFYRDLTAALYSTSLAGHNYYQVFTIDHRPYKQVGRPGKMFAWQVNGRRVIGKMPLREMSQQENSFDLRGYTQGRYCDKASIMFYQSTEIFYRANGEISGHGAVGWLGTQLGFRYSRFTKSVVASQLRVGIST